MSSNAARQIADQPDVDLDEPTGEDLERLRAQIAESRAYFADGGKGIPHDVVMQELRAIRNGG